MYITQRIAALREEMQREHLAAYIFTSTDAHNGEYVPDHWKGREWISGFNGSAGTAVVTLSAVALWTDSRYFLAAEEQLKGTEFQLMKLKMPGTPTIAQWIGEQVRKEGYSSTEVGINGMTNGNELVDTLKEELRHEGGLTLRTNYDPLPAIWTDRPEIPLNPVEIHPLRYAGEETQDKLQRIRKALREKHADGMLVSALDDIAWTLNMRGTDVHCTPVFVAYLLISTQKATLFIDTRKLNGETKAYLKENGIAVRDYQDIKKGLRDYPEYNILLDPNETCYTLMHAVNCEIIKEESPIARMKTVKNPTEIKGFRLAMLKDGIAMVKFLCWLKPAVEAGNETELSLDRKLTGLRAEQEGFRDISFDTICGYEEHGAIVHYEATPETDIPVKAKGLVLIDSGAQYLDGTTDITRTIALGPLTEEQRKAYTLVLRGHIQLAMCKFPYGSAGTQMDVLARQFLWREGMNYLHGTGHGVGQYLSVHEGPHQFRMEWKPAPFVPGMTVTNEPGIYLPGRFGVRIENTMLVVPFMKGEFGEFLQLEPLTLCPIDTTPVIRSMIQQEEADWLNSYHEQVYKSLAPFLDDKEREWLRNATLPV